MLVDQVVIKGAVGGVADGTAVAAVDTRYGAVLNVV